MGKLILISMLLSLAMFQATVIMSYTLNHDPKPSDDNSPTTSVQCGDILYEDTILTDSLVCSGDGLIMGTDSISLNCNGFSVAGVNTGKGITVSSRNNVHVNDCNIRNFRTAVYLFQSKHVIIESNKLNSSHRALSVTLSDSNTVLNNVLAEEVGVDGSFNTFEGDTFNFDPGFSGEALLIESPNNTITDNVFTGSGQGRAILTTDYAVGNTFTGNTISDYYNGIIIGGGVGGLGPHENILFNNSFIDNWIGIDIDGGDLNQVYGNLVSSVDGGFGFDVSPGAGFNANNIIWDNDIYSENNIWGIDYNVYCFEGIQNRYYFEAPACGDSLNSNCIPDCSERLDDSGGFFNDDYGWPVQSHPEAIGGSLRVRPPGDGTEPVQWHVHTIEGDYMVGLWRFVLPDPEMFATNSSYTVVHKDGEALKLVDWTEPIEGWQNLGKYTFTNDPDQGVWLSDFADGYLDADAAKIISVRSITADHKDPESITP